MYLTNRRTLRALALALLAAAPLAVACSGDKVSGPGDGSGGTPTPGSGGSGPAAALTITGGNSQPDTTVGSKLQDPLVVRVTDAAGSVVRDVTVSWAVATGGGSVSAATSSPDANGLASTRWTLGPATGAPSVTARVGSLPAVTFTANAKGSAVASIAKVAGDSQAALVNLALTNPIKVRVLDSFGNPVKDADVTWTASGDGIVTPTVPATDANGEATATGKLGSTPGIQTLQVTSNGKAVAFSATATVQYASADAGGFDACGITPSAQAFCWGFNDEGQLGTGQYDAGTLGNTPVFASPTDTVPAYYIGTPRRCR